MVLPAVIWNYFNKISEEKAICRVCSNEYSFKTTTSNLRKHLRSKHKDLEENFGKSETLIDISLEKTEHDTSESDSESDSSQQVIKLVRPTIKVAPSETLQQRKLVITPYVTPKLEHQQPQKESQTQLIDQQLLRMITQDYQPCSIVEDEGFKAFVKALNPNYKLPNKKFLSGTLLPAQYMKCRNDIVELVEQAKKCCLTIECWTSLTTDAYFSVTAHFLVDFELKSVLLHCEQFDSFDTSDILASAVINIAQQWNLTDKITLVVADNASNITNALKLIEWPFFGCFLLKLNSVVEKALNTIDMHTNILDIVKKVVRHFKKSNNATQTLTTYQIDGELKSEPYKLIDSVSTRWHSVFNMLERFIKLQNCLQEVMPKLNVELPRITADIWDTIKEVCMILKLFEEVTRIMSVTKYLSASLVIVIVDGLRNAISKMYRKIEHGTSRDFLKRLEEGLDTYFPKHEIEDNMLLGICTFLDPRFKIHAFLDDNAACLTEGTSSQRPKRAELIKEHILELLKTKLGENNKMSESYDPLRVPTPQPKPAPDEGISLWGKIDKTIAAVAPDTKSRNEIDMFLKEDVVPRHSCPLSWWKSHASLYPNLAEIFLEHCHAVVTSVEYESVFSKEGQFKTQKRAALSRKRTAQLVFLNVNEGYCKKANRL